MLLSTLKVVLAARKSEHHWPSRLDWKWQPWTPINLLPIALGWRRNLTVWHDLDGLQQPYVKAAACGSFTAFYLVGISKEIFLIESGVYD